MTRRAGIVAIALIASACEAPHRDGGHWICEGGTFAFAGWCVSIVWLALGSLAIGAAMSAWWWWRIMSFLDTTEDLLRSIDEKLPKGPPRS